MKSRFLMGALSALLFALISQASFAFTADDLKGTWQLVEAVVTSEAASEPRGMPNVKEYYADDGRLYIIQPTAGKDDKTSWVSYRIEGTQRFVTKDNHSKKATISFPEPGTMLVTQTEGDVWRYVKLPGEHAYDTRLEPVSVEVFGTINLADARKIRYDSNDYSSKAPDQRIQGSWEVIEYRDIAPQEMPPFGYLNDVWGFTADKVALSIRQRGEGAAPIELPYSLKNNFIALANGSKTASIACSFDDWGHLVLNMDGHTIVLKLISKTSTPVIFPPLKIVLTKFKSDAADK